VSFSLLGGSAEPRTLQALTKSNLRMASLNMAVLENNSTRKVEF